MTNHPLVEIQNKITIDAICEIDLSRVALSRKPDGKKYKFLGFVKCKHRGSGYYESDSCFKCKGKMRFQNLETHEIKVSCYGYQSDCPVIIIPPLEDSLFEI
jgi:hypothetical protein